MNRRIYSSILFCIILESAAAQFFPPETLNDRQRVDKAIERLALQGVSLSQELGYEFFFVHPSRKKLQKVSKELVLQGYTEVGLQSQNKQQYQLHMRKVEINTASTLYDKFSSFRSKYNDAVYDSFSITNRQVGQPLVPTEAFLKLIAQKSGNELWALGFKLYRHGVYDKAKIIFVECMKAGVKADTTYMILANLYSLDKNYDTVFKYLNNAIALNPAYANAYYNLGYYYDELQQLRTALPYFLKAVELDPEDDINYYAVAVTYYHLGKMESATHYCSIALKLNPKNEYAKRFMQGIVAKPYQLIWRPGEK